ncbi:MAG: prephenate dehydrogenase/arogenate dehydrogenase family protein [Proteobacteria bacterium]|jgi:prephenate dehydrogenase|nr:prephenate dehydrogenase/arogenate dehydrogenase family protein [Pseudomonadota bacterium]MDA0942132.1 prephenate dehydrogenase/arogenate dehydrogenase family protein [Pseudomonadota bacterium]MDA1034166.1 prephenate dehydrogenase/arogenate dehydrogenase family protein [Pseudomonadota bacterium]
MNKLCIIGLGLLGGSIGKDCIANHHVKHVIGFGKNKKTLETAKQLNLVHYISDDYTDIQDADLVIIATPVRQIDKVLNQIKPHLSEKTIITDVGSTKYNVLTKAKSILGEHFKNFIGSHPIAGSEKHGPEAAQESLFHDKNIIVTTHDQNNDKEINVIKSFWHLLKGKVIIMDAQQHDEIFSTVSHLPHALAMIFMNMIFQKSNKEQLLNFAASGFRDFTRIAASSPEMWKDIFIDNKDACINDLAEFKKQIEFFEKILNDEDQLENFIESASQLRKNWKY